MIVFSSIHGDFEFQAISAVFLTQSGMIMTAMVYLNLYENKFNLIYFLTKFMKKDGDKPDPTRENDLLEEIEKQKGDDDWMPSIHDIFDMITIGKISEKKMMNAFGRGFQRIAMDNSDYVKFMINGGLFVIYLVVLFLYSYLVWDLDSGSKLGIVSSIAVAINDIYMYICTTRALSTASRCWRSSSSAPAFSSCLAAATTGSMATWSSMSGLSASSPSVL